MKEEYILDQLVQEQLKVLNPNKDVELALTPLARPELVRKFRDLYWTFGRGEQIN